MKMRFQARLKGAAFKSWLGIASLWGAGLLPCPDCGAPMLLHFWPVALVMTLVQLRRERPSKMDPSPGAPTFDVARSSGDRPNNDP